MNRRRMYLLGAAMLALAALSGCGGGGGSGSTGSTGTTGTTGNTGTTSASALKVADKVSVVDAQSGTGGTVAKIRALILGAVTLPATSDYNKDQTSVYIADNSVNSFDQVNKILCMLSQTRYDAMLNKGPYKALINENLCETSSGQSTSASEQSADSAPKYTTFVCEATRADNNSPQILSAWVHEAADPSKQSPGQVIFVKVVITESASSTNPYGQFTMNFVGYAAKADGSADTSTVRMKGFIKTVKDATSGKVTLQFAESGNYGNGTELNLAALNKNADGSGNGSTSGNMGGSGTTVNTDFAYNSSFFHRKDNTGDVCLNRTDFENSAWNYGLYDATGTRVAINSGFPIKVTKSGTTAYGWVGYWGLNFPNGVTLANGDTVARQSYDGSPDVNYTAVVSGGKLKKHTRHATTLGAIKNVPLDGWMEGMYPNQQQYEVVWDGTQFNKVKKMVQGSTGPTFQDMTPTPISMSSLQMNNLYFWSQSLGGQVIVKLGGCSYTPGQQMGMPGTFACTAPTNATAVVFFSEDMVYPNDTIPATLACANNCPAGSAIDTTNPYTNPEIGFKNQPPATAIQSATTYSFDSANMVLKEGTKALVTTASATQWGVMSGPLFDPTVQANLDALKCDNDPSGNSTCGWQAGSNLSVYYTWETSPNSWNQFAALKDATGAFLRFDPPLPISYLYPASGTGSTAADAKYANVTFNLQYAGYGNLQGIPGKCVDMNTGAAVDCSTGGPNTPVRWVPEFTIPAGSTATDNSGSVTYYIKPLQMEQRMKQAAAGSCGSLPVSTLTLPSISDWTDPALGTESATALTAAPAVIGGVVQ